VDEDYPWPPKQIDADPDLSTLRSFKTRIREQLVLDTFTTPDDLALKVGTALGRFMVERSVEEGLRVASESQHAGTETTQNQVARRAGRLAPLLEGARILLVNDNPREMQHVIRILRELNLEVVVATSTDVGLAILEADQFDAVISDMRRGEIADAGTRFIAAMRERGVHRPTIISAGRYKPELGTPPFAFGITNRVDELLNLLFDTLERIRG
jgi:CheY-like chemotaxis protein